MFSKFALYIAASMAVLAAAAPPSSSDLAARDSCNGGSVHCCNSVASATPANKSMMKALIGVDVGDVTGLIGLTCSPVTVVGGGGNACSSQTVCCSNNNFSGLVVVGCTPINVNVIL